jgi:peptidyl-prolyl cis-trans isomerase A (cyclophilin A)
MIGFIETICARRTIAAAVACLAAPVAHATIVEFQTSEGTFQVNLYDNGTPETVANFLEYVNNGAYTNAVIHRSVPGFVIQGGGFTFDMATPLDPIPTNPAVVNEPEFANVRGTIAMAKLSGNPDSATSQWFFNLADNTSILDGQNGGFTAFGEVMGDGMDVVDAIAALPVYNFSGATSEIPLRNYTQQDYDDGVPVDGDNFVMITAVIVRDTTVDTAPAAIPANTASNPPSQPPPSSGGGGSSGGGAIGLPELLVLIGLGVYRRRTFTA